jgi:translocation and assembly module TamB
MARTIRILAWVTGVLIVLPVALITLVVVVANMDWGRRLLELTTAQLSGGQVVLTGVSGRFPDDLRIAHAEVHDADSLWLSADDVALQWSPSRLASKRLQIQLLRVGRIELRRLPTSSTSREDSSEPFKLPVRVDVAQVEIDELAIGVPLAGVAASVSIQGSVRAASLQEAEAALTVSRLDAPGSYQFSGRIDPASLKIDLDLNEPPQGLLAGLANLPDLGALSVQATVDGPRNATAMRLAIAAGPLRASGLGTLDLAGQIINLDVTASAPAMTPRQDVSWKQVSLQAHVHGPFKSPDAKGQVRIDGLSAGAVQLHTFRADVEGNRGWVGMHAVLDRLRIPGPKPDLLQSAPIDLRADVKLDDPKRPVTFALSHPLVSMQGNANTGGELSGALTINAFALAPFAAIAGVDLKGRTTLNANFTASNQATKVDLTGVVGVTGGVAPIPALIGDGAKLAVSAKFQGEDVTIERAQLDGKTLRVSADGSVKHRVVDLNWKMALSDLTAVASAVSGQMEAHGRVQGPQGNLNLVADATGDAGTEGFPRGPIKASMRLQGLPGAPAGRVDAQGSLDRSPLELAMTLQHGGDSSLLATIERADWKSVHAEGSVGMRASDRLPQGRMAVQIARLSDLQPWIGQDAQGSVVANVDVVPSGGHVQAKIELDARNAAIGRSQIDHLNVTGRVDDPTTHPNVALQFAANNIVTNGLSGNARLQADGPLDALVLKLSADLHNVAEAQARVTATATLNMPAKQMSLSALQAHYKDQTAQLLAPARVSFGDGLAVDRLRVGMQQAVLEAAGRVAPTLDLTASLRNVTPALVKTFVPDLQAEGTMNVEARLTGTTAQPRGTVRLNGNGLRMRTGAGPTLPAATLQANADLEGQFARIDVRLSGGSQVRLNASGRLPLSMTAPIDVHGDGTIDATIANPILEVNGRRVKGQISLDLAVSGNFAMPRIDGSAKLAQGEIQDYALGAHLTNVEALIQATGDTLRIASLTAQAGPGTVSASGTVGLLAAGRPVDVKLTARNARALASDLLTADTDLDLTLRGPSTTRLDVTGKIIINNADINIPSALPPTVAVLDVRRPGQKPPPPPSTPAMVIGFDLTVDAPGQVFVRGRGLDAEAGGELHVAGTTAAPQISGGFEMRRGTFDLGGASLKFTSGKVGLNGRGLTQKIDPTLDFEAESTSGGITAKLAVTGYADAPKITLTSVPDLPQDEILARLLFGTNVRQLTALQIVQIGAAIVSLSGSGGGLNPLLAAQKSLGLDRLSVGSTSTGGTSVEAGRYVSSNVYVGAKQTTSGSTQAKVQVDLTKRLKLQATLGTGGTTVQGITPDNDPGSSIGLSYQFEY